MTFVTTVKPLLDGHLGGNRKCPSYRGVRLIEVFQFWASTWKIMKTGIIYHVVVTKGVRKGY